MSTTKEKKGAILYVHEGLVSFSKGSEPEMAFIMRASRMVPAWLSQIRKTFGDADVKQENLPHGNTGWAIPFRDEQEARTIAKEHFDEVRTERPSLTGSRQESQALKARPAKQEEIVLGVFSVDTVSAEGHLTEAVVALTRNGNPVRVPIGQECAVLCARFIFEDVELVIRRAEE